MTGPSPIIPRPSDSERAAAEPGRGATPWSDKGDHDKAIADLDEAIRLEPGNAFFFAARGGSSVPEGGLRQGDRRLHRVHPDSIQKNRKPTATGAGPGTSRAMSRKALDRFRPGRIACLERRPAPVRHNASEIIVGQPVTSVLTVPHFRNLSERSSSATHQGGGSGFSHFV